MSPASHDGTSKANIPTSILILVVCYSFFGTFNPMLAYSVPYMVQIKGITNFQITNKIYPIGNYALLACTLLAAPICKYVSSKTIIVAGSFAFLLDKLLLRFGMTVLALQIMEVISAIYSASYIIYQGYLFSLVTENHFQTMTSVSLASASAAIFVSSQLGQILVLYGVPYDTILYITIASGCIICILSFTLPKGQITKEEQQHSILDIFSSNQAFWLTITATWAENSLRLLSAWFIMGLPGIVLSLDYVVTLFEAIDSASTYNGQVIAVGTALSVLVSLSSVYLKTIAARMGGFLYIIGSVMYGALCLAAGYSQVLWLAYSLYIIMAVLEKYLICFLYAQCGSLVKNDNYALMFSLNCGLALVVKVALQAFLEIAGVHIHAQYKVIGIYFFGVSVAFSALYGLYVWKARRVEIVFSSANLTKVDPSHQPLIDNEHVVPMHNS